MDYKTEISSLLQESEEQLNLEDRLLLIRRAINIADAHNDITWGYELRIHFISTELQTNHSRGSIPVFSWILDTCDNNPGTIPVDVIVSIYAWMACVAFYNIEFSVNQIDKVTEDFRRRLQENGYGLREYYNVKINQSLFVGDNTSARKYLELREQLPLVDEDIGMENIDIISKIYVEISEDNIEAAIFHIREIEKQPDLDIPKVTFYSGLIYQFMMKGRDELARKYFDEIDREFSLEEKFPYQLYHVSLMMYYMSKHNQDKAWAYFEQFANWEQKADDVFRFHFATSVLPLTKGPGIRVIDAINVNHPCYRPDNRYQLSDLYQYYKNIATDLGYRFDKRNGTCEYVPILEKFL